jgi:targeting protein for Xklp2
MLPIQVLPKREPKPCTRTEGFQLQSLVRHKIEHQRLMQREWMERQEAQRRLVKAQPIHTEG